MFVIKHKDLREDGYPQGAYRLVRKLGCELVKSQPATQAGNEGAWICRDTDDKLEEGEGV